jgi:glucose/arabinose dehydrogenase
MRQYTGADSRLKAYSQMNDTILRYVDPSDINLPPEYMIEVFALGLDSPMGIAFSEEGDLYIAESGATSGNPKVLHLNNNQIETIADNFNVPITGINYMDGNIYVTNRGKITVLRSDGSRQDILSGLPCNGDYGASNVAFGSDGKLYFGLGAVTNSGVVGEDNPWVYNHPLMHDEPVNSIILNGQNYVSNNIFAAREERVETGAYSAYGVPNSVNEIKKGVMKGSGSILRVNRDGTDLELVAWGFRNPIHIRFDREFHLLAANRGYDVRGSRPIANAPDELHMVTPGVWYGWPDYCVGEPVTLPRFTPEGRPRLNFLLTYHPNIPPIPFAEFQPHTSIMGFDFNYNEGFGPVGDIYIAEFGSLGAMTMGQSAPPDGMGFRVSRVDGNNGQVSTFIANKSGLPSYYTDEGGFGRLVDVKFGPLGELYLLDSGISDINNSDRTVPNTGVIWRVTRTASRD